MKSFKFQIGYRLEKYWVGSKDLRLRIAVKNNTGLTHIPSYVYFTKRGWHISSDTKYEFNSPREAIGFLKANGMVLGCKYVEPELLF